MKHPLAFTFALLASLPVLGALSVGPQSTIVGRQTQIVVTNDTTNSFYLSGVGFTFSNNPVVTGGTFEVWWQRGIFSNQLLNLSYTNATNVAWFPAGRTYIGRNDRFIFKNTTTNILYFYFSLDL